jgi:hypothetical protein
MSYRQFIWGLSNGILVLALAGAFWFRIADPTAPVVPTVLLIAGAVAIVAASLRLRRKASGFKFSEIKNGDERQRTMSRRIQLQFRYISIAQLVLVGLGVFLCARFNRIDLVWPVIGLVVSLHFLPLARTFHLRAYNATGLLGAAASLLALVPLDLSPDLVVGIGMGACLWGTALYLVCNADNVARAAGAAGP